MRCETGFVVHVRAIAHPGVAHPAHRRHVISMAQVPDKPIRSDVAAFLDRVAAMPAVRPVSGRQGRLLFAMDATASRQPSWDRACHLMGGMFAATRDLGGLSLSLAYYRGFGEFAATPWLADAAEVVRRMSGVACLGGQTQILRVLHHAARQNAEARVAALVFVGDAVEEDIDALCHAAGRMGLRGTPGFFFHEGGDPVAANAFRQMAKVSGGAYAPFDAGSADQLLELLRAVAVFAAGGRTALTRLPGQAARAIAGQLAAPR